MHPIGTTVAFPHGSKADEGGCEAKVAMSMAFVSCLRRPLGLLLISTMLTACSAGGLAPPGDIDGRNTVGAIQPMDDVPREGGDFPDADMPGSEPVAMAGEGQQPASLDGGASEKRLPMIDSDEALGIAGTGTNTAAMSIEIPEGGVNMDAALGVAPVEGLAEAQANEIAEGNATQVMVDGIGTDTPQQVGDPVQIPMSEAGGELGASADEGNYLRIPDEGARTMPIVEEEREVAFIPRLSDPMQIPETMGGMPAAEKSCRQRLQRLGVKFRDIPTISKGKSCGIAYPIELSGLSGGIQIKPAAKVNCQITEAFALWVKKELAPATRVRYVSGIKSIHQMSSYSCRTMNSRRGNPMSEHAKGNAIDVGKITLDSGKSIKIERKGFFSFREKGLLKTVRSDSCTYFSTVLGPGSDRYHKDHFHFDLRTRKNGGRYCSL